MSERKKHKGFLTRKIWGETSQEMIDRKRDPNATFIGSTINSLNRTNQSFKEGLNLFKSLVANQIHYCNNECDLGDKYDLPYVTKKGIKYSDTEPAIIISNKGEDHANGGIIYFHDAKKYNEFHIRPEFLRPTVKDWDSTYFHETLFDDNGKVIKDSGYTHTYYPLSAFETEFGISHSEIQKYIANLEAGYKRRGGKVKKNKRTCRSKRHVRKTRKA